MKLKILLLGISVLIHCSSLSFGQTIDKKQDQVLLNACLENDFEKVFKMLGEGYRLDNSREASYQLYTLLQNQTKVESGMTMVNFEVVKTENYYLRKPEDNEVFTLLLRAGTDTSMYHIVGFDKSGSSTTKINNELSIVSGGEASNNSRVVFQTDSGLNALEYAMANSLTSFIEAFDIISFPLIKHITDPETVEILLNEGNDVNQVSKVKGYTALNLACQHGNHEIIDILLENGANPDLAQKNGLSPISSAAFRGDVILGKKLIEAGASIFSYIEGEILPYKYAVLNNHVDFVALLLENGMDVNYQFAESSYAAYYAAQQGYLDMLKMLVAHGADIEKKVEGGQTPVCIASYFGHLDVVEYLAEKGVRLDDPDFEFNTPLMHAYTHGYTDIVLYLLKAGADPDIKDHQGKSLIHFAAYHNNVPVLSYLLENGADPDQKMDHEATPILIAAEQERKNIIKLLLDYNANPNIPDSELNTPLLVAVKAKNQDLVKLLLDGGADPDFPLKEKETVLFYCIKNNDLATANLLIDGGANINARDRYHENLLFKTEDAEMLDYLFRNGIEDKEGNFRGQTALTQALKTKNLTKAQKLLELGSPLTNANTTISTYETSKSFGSLLKEHGATFKVRDESYDLEDPFYTNFNLILGMGMYAPKTVEKKSWPFSMGMSVGIVPVYRFKVNTNILFNFMGVSDIYYTNLHIQPTLRYTFYPDGYFLGAGLTWSYLLGISSSDYPDISIPDGFNRNGFAPYFTLGYENSEASFELGYRMRTASQPGIVCINLGFEISSLLYY